MKLDTAKEEYVKDALLHDPKGSLCGYCGKANDWADDCGWYYLSTTKHPKPVTRSACKTCFETLYHIHAARYGVGER